MDDNDADKLLDAVRSQARPVTRADLLKDDKGIESVSMIALIANPESYDGVQVRVIGYLHLEFESDAIYLHRDDFENGISKNALGISQPADVSPDEWQGLNDQYVLCQGTFRADWMGHMAMNSGTIDDIQRLEPWLTRADLAR
jgi:hypothetical protein